MGLCDQTMRFLDFCELGFKRRNFSAQMCEACFPDLAFTTRKGIVVISTKKVVGTWRMALGKLS